jgi:hypothetical protein
MKVPDRLWGLTTSHTARSVSKQRKVSSQAPRLYLRDGVKMRSHQYSGHHGGIATVEYTEAESSRWSKELSHSTGVTLLRRITIYQCQ